MIMVSGVDAVRSWGKKQGFNPFRYDFILMPVNDAESHWFLLIIDYPARALTKRNAKDSEKSSTNKP
jgi:Ulp1 family protease